MSGSGCAGHESRAQDDVERVVAAPIIINNIIILIIVIIVIIPLAVSDPGEHRLGANHLPDVVTHRVET